MQSELRNYRICISTPLREVWRTVKANNENAARVMASRWVDGRRGEYIKEVVASGFVVKEYKNHSVTNKKL